MIYDILATIVIVGASARIFFILRKIRRGHNG